MRTFLHKGVVMIVGVAVGLGTAAVPGRAADDSKGLRKRIRKLERRLEETQAELQVVQDGLTEAQAVLLDLSDTVANVPVMYDKLKYINVVLEPLEGLRGPHLIFEGCNVHIRSGSGDSVDGTVNLNSHSINSAVIPTGLGNLIIGYNESLEPDGADRGGSHNLVIGPRHNYPSVCGMVLGQENSVTGPLAAIIGGLSNHAEGYTSTVSGGYNNTASGWWAAVAGGGGNVASGAGATVTGGGLNVAGGSNSSVSGGRNRSAGANDDWAAGSLFEND